MTQQEINNYLARGEGIDPYNVKKTRVLFKSGKSIVGGFYKENQHHDYEKDNAWLIIIEGKTQAELVSGETIEKLTDMGVR